MRRFLLNHTIKLIVFWLIVFILSRTLFLVYNHALLDTVGFIAILQVYVQAIPLDFSAIGYLLIVPYVAMLFYSIKPHKFFIGLFNGYLLVMLSVVLLMCTVDPILYAEWKVKINYKAFTYLTNPSEVFLSAPKGSALYALLLIGLQLIVSIFIWKKWLDKKQHELPRRNYITTLVYGLLMPIIVFTMMRGGWQQIPINQSSAYFSTHQVLNAAAVNTFWNAGQSYVQNQKYLNTNPYIFYKQAEATEQIKQLYATKGDTTQYLFKTQRPNIVLFILEGWSADLLEAYQQRKGVAPVFDSLCKQGYLFNQCYATGTLSDQGIVALLSGFPAQPTTRIIRQPDKFVHLPSINHALKKAGYYSSFYFGGDLEFGNIKGYLYFNKYDKIIEHKDLPSGMYTGKLGVHDGDLFNYLSNELNQQQQPFFTSVFTMSTHTPYDYPPQKKKLFTEKIEEEYTNAMHYSDQCIGAFLQRASKQSWYKNTVFIFISDHSHGTPVERSFHDPLARKIPFLLVGEPLLAEYKGKQNANIVAQFDFPKMILNQLQLNANAFKWSKDVLTNKNKEFAYFTYADGFGYITPNNFLVYDNMAQQMMNYNFASKQDSVRVSKQGKSFLQTVFADYLNY